MTDEQKLIKKAMRGNVDAYGWLMDQYKAYLYRMAYYYAGNEPDALDIVSESVLKGFQNMRQLKKAEYFKTWMTRILINTAKDFVQRRELTGYEDVSASNEQETSREDGISQEERMDLLRAVELLNEKYKTVILLKYFSELKIAEIAEIMDIPEGSVSAYLTRAKEELKKILKEDYYYA